MTNVTPPPSEPPVGGTPASGATPGAAPGAYGSTPGATPPPYSAPANSGGPVKQTLSLTSFIVGVANLVLLSWGVPILGLLGGVAAIILALQARKREPNAPSWMWIVGLVSGILGALINLIVSISWLFILLAFGAAFSNVPTY